VELIFKNHLGTIQFKGRRHPLYKQGVIIKGVSGLGLPEREYKLASFINCPGQKLIASRDLARLITLSVDVYSEKQAKAHLRHMLEILYQPGELTLFSGRIQRKIACRCTEVSEPESHGNNFVSVVLQFTCDNPYFTDFEPQQVLLFKRTDLISENFSLPCMFTQRINRCLVVNDGCVASEPIITVVCAEAEASPNSESKNDGILIINHSTGQKIRLLCEGVSGETVTINIPERKIISDLQGELTSHLSSDSFLGAFILQSGENDIEIVNLNARKSVVVTMTFDNRYVEAVV